MRLIGEEGVDAVSHRRVAELADVPLGSTTYWFASRQDMLVQAFEHFAHLEIESLRSRLSRVLNAGASRDSIVEEFIAFLLPQLDDERWRTIAMYALFQEAARLPELSAVCHEWNIAWHGALAEVFTALGSPDPHLAAQMFCSLLDGLMLNQLADPQPAFEHAVVRPILHTWFAFAGAPDG